MFYSLDFYLLKAETALDWLESTSRNEATGSRMLVRVESEFGNSGA